MRTELPFALAAAALFLGGCGKATPASSPPGGSAAADEPATAAAAAGTDEPAADEAAEVKCFGINECGGKSSCDVAGSHECGGQNECKGKGWILAPASECESKGGSVL